MEETDERMVLMRITDAIGTQFGTDRFSVFLYALITMVSPEVIVELGTGLGLSAFWMAVAAKRNAKGVVYSVDNFSRFSTERESIEGALSSLRERLSMQLDERCTADQYFQVRSDALGIRDHLRLIKATMNLNDPGHFSKYPFSDKPIDLLFSDFKHGARDIIALVGQFLPRMAESSSIFIHSAPGAWTSHLVLEQLCLYLNSGRVPKLLKEQCFEDLEPIVRQRRFTLVQLTEPDRLTQNSAAWIKIEPIDLLANPRLNMKPSF